MSCVEENKTNKENNCKMRRRRLNQEAQTPGLAAIRPALFLSALDIKF